MSFRATCLVLAALTGCGRVAERRGVHDGQDGEAARDHGALSDAGASGVFGCRSSGIALRFRYAFSIDDEAREFGSPIPITVARTAGDDVLAATSRVLFQLSRDGVLLHRAAVDDSTSVLDLNSLATLALVRSSGGMQVLRATGETVLDLGPDAGPRTEGVLRASFTESGNSVVVELGHMDLEHEAVTAIEIRASSSSDVRRYEGARKLFVGSDDQLVVKATGSELTASDPGNSELWRASYHTLINVLYGSRNARTIFAHSDSIGFYEGADNSGLLVVDGNVNTVPYLWPAGFSPDGTYVASGDLGTLTMRRDGKEIWRSPIAPELLVDSVSVNDQGQTLVSGMSRYRDAGASTGHALLFGADGALLAQCESPDASSRVYSAFSYEGDTFMLYGGFGVVGYDLR